ncbi:DUF599 domain-containing protein [Thiobacter aerophilum]|uniref:DUF599 domain-containing protein n=1 Tax=Thiobacter aerophilum TaxID=3121275 RepID=A0ABV0EEY2_9BURK
MNSFAELKLDIIAFTVSAAMVAGYYLFLHFKGRSDPTYTIHRVNALARRLWVENVMRNPNKDVMAVQTLRNFIMGSSLMASTAALLVMGTLTLSGQADNIAQSWHALSLGGSYSSQLWILKVMLLLVDFIVAFFAFALSIRLANHVLFMVNIPAHDAHHSLAPRAVARRLNRAGHMFAVGMRAFFFAIPLVFWLFGPWYLLLASTTLVFTLHHLDRSDSLEELESESLAEPRQSPVISMQQAKRAT